MENQAFGAIEHIARAVAAGGRGDVGKIVTGLPFGMSEGKPKFAARDLRQEVGAHRVSAAEPDQAAGKNDSCEIGLERQRPADLLHHDHGLDRPTAGAAVFFVERQPKQAKLGIALPHAKTPAARLLHVALARFERVVIGEQPLDAMAQNLLLFGQREIHFRTSILLRRFAPRNDEGHSPKIALAMMFF